MTNIPDTVVKDKILKIIFFLLCYVDETEKYDALIGNFESLTIDKKV